jgi:hypothetical protein
MLGTAMTDSTERIKSKLATLKSLDLECRIFGADHHRYRTGPTLLEAELQAVETFFRVDLPPDYRAFLSRIGNGGAGPGLGLQRFAASGQAKDMPDDFADYYETAIRALEQDPNRLARPCPLVRSICRSDMDVPEDMEAYLRWEREIWNPLDDGMLELANYGCGLKAKLVLTGSARGSIWVVDECDGAAIDEFQDCADGMGSGTPLPQRYSFADWHEFWLDGAIAEC